MYGLYKKKTNAQLVIKFGEWNFLKWFFYIFKVQRNLIIVWFLRT